MHLQVAWRRSIVAASGCARRFEVETCPSGQPVDRKSLHIYWPMLALQTHTVMTDLPLRIFGLMLHPATASAVANIRCWVSE